MRVPPRTDAPATLPYEHPQPRPVETRAVRHHNSAGWITGIYRKFREGESASCTRCPAGTCCAAEDACLMIVDGLVPRGEAANFRTADLPGFGWDDAGRGVALGGFDPAS